MARTLVAILLTALGLIAPADAQLLHYPGGSDAAARLEALDGELETAFHAAIAEYDGEIEIRPFDVGRRVDRCRFIDQFSYTNEFLSWLDEVYELAEECIAEVESEFANHPEVVLYRLELLYGEDLLDAARPYVGSTSPPGWSRGQVARLFTLLATAADTVGNGAAGSYAEYALGLDAAANVRVIAAQSLIDQGDRAAAVEVLLSPFDVVTPTENPWYFVDKISLLAMAGDSSHIAELYRQLKESSAYYDSSTVAIALRDAGQVDLARSEFEAAAANPGYLVNTDLERFRFELEFGSATQARDAFESLRDKGWSADVLGINRFALFMEHPSLAWRWRDLLGAVGLLVALSASGLLLLIPVSVVHYRGLVRRVRQGIPAATAGLRLRHAWFGLCALWLASFVGLYFAGPVDLMSQQDNLWGFDVDPDRLTKSLVAEWLLAPLFVLPIAWFVVRREPALPNWSFRKAAVIALAAALVLRLPLLISWFVQQEIPSLLAEGSLQWELLNRVVVQYGLFTAFWLIIVAAPVVEEFVFRQVLLTTFARQISFGAANLIQAGLFAAMHFDAAALPYLFVMGLVAGFMARRSGGLTAPILFHAVFNLVAGLPFLTD